MNHLLSPLLLLLLMLSPGPKMYECARVFTIINYCKETIWPGITPGDNFDGGGFELKPGRSIVFQAPVGWSGRIWGRTGCKFDKNGNGSCLTADCGNTLKCKSPGKTPVSLAEFTLSDVDYYDVSLVDGFNLPVSIKPINGQGNCSSTGCDLNLRRSCPNEVAVNGSGNEKAIGCRSACSVFDTDRHCCRGTYANPVTCKPTFYSKKFKEACPTAYSYAYDDPASIFSCAAADYVVSFCSPSNLANGLNPMIATWWSAMPALLFLANLWAFLRISSHFILRSRSATNR